MQARRKKFYISARHYNKPGLIALEEVCPKLVLYRYKFEEGIFAHEKVAGEENSSHSLCVVTDDVENIQNFT